jgi:succinoglycan biosynthesis transport protein ExoP
VGATLLAAAAALVVSFLSKPVYEARAGVVIARVRPQVRFEPSMVTLSEEQLGFLRVDTTARQNTLVALVKNPEVEARVVQKLNDAVSPELRHPGGLLEAGVTGRLAKGELIEISVRGRDPGFITLVANAWAEEYESYINRLYSGSAETGESVRRQADAARAEYESAERALVAFTGDNEKTALRAEIESKQEVLTYHYQIINRNEKLLVDGQGLLDQVDEAGDSGAGRLANGLALVRLQAAVVGSGVGKPFDVQLNVAEGGALLADASDQRGDIDALLSLLQEQRDESFRVVEESSLLDDMLRLEAALEEELARERELTRARDLAWDTYKALARKAGEADVAEQTIGSEVKFAVPAIEPRWPVGPRKVLNTVVAGALGLVIGLLGAFGAEYLRESDRTSGK